MINTVKWQSILTFRQTLICTWAMKMAKPFPSFEMLVASEFLHGNQYHFINRFQNLFSAHILMVKEMVNQFAKRNKRHPCFLFDFL